jgi:hypothetical protein
VVRDEARLTVGAPIGVHLQQPELAEPHIGPDLLAHGQEAVVGDDEEGRAFPELVRRQRGEEPRDQPIDVLDGPVGLRRARPVHMLEAVRAKEVDQKQVGAVLEGDVGGQIGHHRVLEEALG